MIRHPLNSTLLRLVIDTWAELTTLDEFRGVRYASAASKHYGSAGSKHHGLETVTYLSPSDQEAMPYRITKLLPWSHLSRKSVGYLYAIHHGAKVSVLRYERCCLRSAGVGGMIVRIN